jgi:hypothetical protein
MAIVDHLVTAIVGATQRYPDLGGQWHKVFAQLAGPYNSTGALLYQSDYRIDLLLRAMEAEAMPWVAKGEFDEKMAASFEAQLVLSRYWLLSIYETLRVASHSEAGRGDEKLKTLFERFNLVRIPPAKFRIARDGNLVGGRVILGREPIDEGPEVEPAEYLAGKGLYHPPIKIDEGTGSIGWELFEAATLKSTTLFRQQLSDELLSLFD